MNFSGTTRLGRDIVEKNWHIKSVAPQSECLKLARILDIPLIIARLLLNRGISSPEETRQFFASEPSSNGLHSPFLLKDMDIVVDRIKRAARNKERVLIFGDYDVDGITSSALLYDMLNRLGIDTENYIPHRLNEGYGLNSEIAEYAKLRGISLIIAVDCGITAYSEVEILNHIGIDVIIVDHHEPIADELPNALAIINPKRKGCSYPFKHLAAVGLVAKLVYALLGDITQEVLDLSAIGTIADVVPLHGENRVLVKAGLPGLSNTNNKGLAALMDITKIKGKPLSSFHIGFVLGPRINASGRMGAADKALSLFLSKDINEAYFIARELERYNQQRQRIQREVVRQAMEIVEEEVDFKEHKVIVLSKEGWHKGVIGIAASKITDKYYRPTIIISIKDGIGTASARSIKGFHIHKALSMCSEYLEHFGGHEGAAGLTIKEDNIDIFRNMINKVADSMLPRENLVPSIVIDACIRFSDINLRVAELIKNMEPFGEGNPVPVFCSKHILVKGRPRVLGKGTLKFWASDDNITFSVIGFGMADYLSIVSSGRPIDIVYEVSIDDWNKPPAVQLILKDLKYSKV